MTPPTNKSSSIVEAVAHARIKAEEHFWGVGRADEVMAATEHAKDREDCEDGTCDLCWANEERRLARAAINAFLDSGWDSKRDDLVHTAILKMRETAISSSLKAKGEAVVDALRDQLKQEIADG